MAQVVPVALGPYDRFGCPGSLSILVDGRTFYPRDVAYTALASGICATPKNRPTAALTERLY